MTGVARIAFPQIGELLDDAEAITDDPGRPNSEAVPKLVQVAKRQAELSADHEQRITALEARFTKDALKQ